MRKREKISRNLKLLLLMVVIVGLGISWLTLSGAVKLPQAQAATTNAQNQIPVYTDKFRFGTNMGWRNSDWTDSQYSDLVAGVGMNSIRVSLPENYLDTWGYDIALANMNHYKTNNLNNLTAFLGSPSANHSNAPANTSYGDLDYYSPSHLYEPIWNADGSVNTNNYWANYVYKTVSMYKPYVKTWEVWNEPDFTNNWQASQTAWWNSPPQVADLPHWNASIFSYIRMLRVSYEVIKRADPNALVATGGLGYEGFLDGILRYTDNPGDGSKNSSYPVTGGAYFDVLSYHYYPQYAVLNLTNNQWQTNTDSDHAVDNLLTQRDNFKRSLTARGYNGTVYPAKYFITTETGFSSQPIAGSAGGMDLLSNYTTKLQILARSNDLKQVYTYMLSDQEPDTSLTDSYNHMGMYYDIAGLASPAQAQRKVAGFATETIARTLEGATYDLAATNALGLPPTVRGAVFHGSNKQTITILWGRTNNNVENASVSFNLASKGNLSLLDQYWSQNKTTRTLSPNNGQINLTLSARPLILIGDTATGPVPTPTKTASSPTPTAIAATPTKTANPPTPTKTAIPPTKTVGITLPTPLPPTTAPAPTNPPGGVNSTLAISAVQASSSDTGLSASSLIDNNLDTYWSVSGVASAWVKLDLGANRQVSSVDYFVYGTDHAPSTKVQYSQDGVNWQTLTNANGVDTGINWGWNSISVGNRAARYIRFWLDNPNNASWTLGYYSEMRVWGR